MRPASNSKSASVFWEVLFQRPLFWICLVGLLAMGGALKAGFYMDDYGFILTQSGDAPRTFRLVIGTLSLGDSSPGARDITLFQLIPTLMTVVTNGLVPMSPAAAHCWNLAIHLILACMVFRLGERLLGHLQIFGSPALRRQAALVGALVFVCHPLGTEPVHYAKCHMVQLVSLFAFWTTCEAVAFLNQPSKKSALCLFAGAMLCVISYFPGTVLIGFGLAAVLLFRVGDSGLAPLRQVLPPRATLLRPKNITLLAALAALLLSLTGYFLYRFSDVLSHWSGLFPVHVATQGRVFWEYVQRMIVPLGLASDHYQPWSTFRDPATLVKLGLLLLLLGLTGWSAFTKGSSQRRGLSLLFLLAMIPLVMRMLYTNIEIMVEYRAYHALPWVGLLAGCGLTALASHYSASKLRWLPAGSIVVGFILLSAQRGTVWRSPILLAENSLDQYPFNNRARNQLQFYDFYAGKYGAVLDRHEELIATIDEIVAENRRTEGRVMIDGYRTNSNLISSYQLAVYARAELEGAMSALSFADQSITGLKTSNPDWFVKTPRQGRMPIWPVLEARAEVLRQKDKLPNAPLPPVH